MVIFQTAKIMYFFEIEKDSAKKSVLYQSFRSRILFSHFITFLLAPHYNMISDSYSCKKTAFDLSLFLLYFPFQCS